MHKNRQLKDLKMLAEQITSKRMFQWQSDIFSLTVHTFDNTVLKIAVNINEDMRVLQIFQLYKDL